MILPLKINTHYQHIETINPKELGIRKKVSIFIVKDLNDQTAVIFQISQKSRFLQKDADNMQKIIEIVTNNIKYTITSKIILIESPLCSKAKAKLKDLQWIVII